MVKKRLLALVLCLMMVFNITSVFADTINQTDVNLSAKIDGKLMEISIEPKEVVNQIKGVKTDTVFTHEKGRKDGIGWVSGKKIYAIENDKLYIETLKNKHTLSLDIGGG